jgi:hypothetical protein
MNSLTSLVTPPPSLLTPSGLAGNLASNAAATPTALNTGGAATSRLAGSWLDEGAQGPSEVLHVGPNSQARAIDDIERDFVQALCQVDAP